MIRLIYVDHRGLGRSDKPHDADAYEMPLRVADALAVLDELGIERYRTPSSFRLQDSTTSLPTSARRIR